MYMYVSMKFSPNKFSFLTDFSQVLVFIKCPYEYKRVNYNHVFWFQEF